MANALLGAYKALRKSVGFAQARNFNLFLLLGGILAVFSSYWFARLLRHGGSYGAAVPAADSPSISAGIARHPEYGIALNTHLLTILPAALLAVLQFVPAVRRRALAVHRWSGRVSVLLSVPGIVATVFLLEHAHGGDPSVRSSCAALGVASSIALARGWWLARQKRIPEHRAWMLRAWSYLASIITMRPITILSAIAISHPIMMGQLYAPIRCEDISFWFEQVPPNPSLNATENLYAIYPECARTGVVVVPAGFTLSNFKAQRFDLIQPAFNLNFGTGVWLAFAIHAALVEWYLSADSQAAKPKKA